MTGRPPLAGQLAECRDCAAPILFVTLDTGSHLPVNPIPTDDGNVCVRVVGARLHGYVISKAHGPAPLFFRMTPHHATCEARSRTPQRQADPVLFDI